MYMRYMWKEVWFMAYTKPIRPALIVAADKVAKFVEQKPDPVIKAKRKQIVAEFRKNNEKK